MPDTDEGWAKITNWHLRRDYRGAMEFFFGECAPEPHSSKVIEDCVGYALQTTPDLLITSDAGALGVEDRAGTLAVLDRVHCPALVIHGDDDRCQPPARATALAEAIGAEQLTLVGAGHLPMAREPVAVNRAIGAFLDRLEDRPPPRQWTVPGRREKRVLYLSSPIGLGHGRRDLAIAEELRRARPDVRIDWLAQPPLTAWLERRGERVHPASRFLASEAAHIDEVAGEHDLHAFEAIRQMDEILVANFMVFSELAEREHFDLWIGDEAWELDHFLHENPELKTTAYAWMTDFVGWLPMTEDCREAELTADYNAEMLDHVARLPRVRDRAIFVGDPQDVVRTPFGPGLPDIRDWTTAHYDFAGYVTGFDPAEIADRTALRESVGFGDEPMCVVAVGGSRGGWPPAAPRGRGLPAAAGAPSGHADAGRDRAADRSGVARRTGRRRGARLGARPAPAARRRGRRARSGRPDDDDGAHGRRPAVRLRAVAAPLRAERARPAPVAALRRGAVRALAAGEPGAAGRGAGRAGRHHAGGRAGRPGRRRAGRRPARRPLVSGSVRRLAPSLPGVRRTGSFS